MVASPRLVCHQCGHHPSCAGAVLLYVRRRTHYSHFQFYPAPGIRLAGYAFPLSPAPRHAHRSANRHRGHRSALAGGVRKVAFSRTHFARMLDVLREDGARVVAFDVTFSKPDESAAPIRALWAQMEARRRRGETIDPLLSAEVQRLATRYDADKRFATAIQRFGAVVLGNFFLHTEADLRGLDDKTLDTYANQIAFYSFPSVRPLRPETGKQDRIGLMEKFQPDNLLPKGTEANLEILTSALSEEASSTGFFNVYPDVDGVVRQANLIIPYGRSKDFNDWDIYASLDVQTVRSYFRLPNEQVVLEYGPVGAYRILFGQSAQVRTDDLGRVVVNFHGPGYTYSHYSLADVVEKKISPDMFGGKIVLVGATATGIGDLRTTPYGGLDYPGVEIHANVIDRS